MEEFVEEREMLIKDQEKKMEDMKKRHHEEIFDLEKEFDEALEQLMYKHGLHNEDDWDKSLVHKTRLSFFVLLLVCRKVGDLRDSI